ncbi:MAG: oligosaccharide flippase family protein, partial [Candidatus Krumholzibacteria bacterium]|nr:oligosaccharide flippase family protein [Candidatus Krumholzibacteria bacterium]
VRNSGVRSMLAFGGHLTGFNVVNYFSRNLDKILIGRYCGTGPVGLYSQAYRLLKLPLQQITTPIAAVAIPALSRLQDESERYRRYYYRAINMIAFITMPLVVMLAALSDEFILIVLGKQWVEVGTIFKVLAFAALVQPVLSTIGWVYISLGQTKRMMHWGFISVPVIILSFIVGLPWGALGVAISYTLCAVLLIPVPGLFFAFRHSPVTVAGFFKAVWHPTIISLIMYAVIELAQRSFAIPGPVLVILYSFVIGVVTLLVILAVWPGVRKEVLDVLKVIKMLRNQREDE